MVSPGNFATYWSNFRLQKLVSPVDGLFQLNLALALASSLWAVTDVTCPLMQQDADMQ